MVVSYSQPALVKNVMPPRRSTQSVRQIVSNPQKITSASDVVASAATPIKIPVPPAVGKPATVKQPYSNSPPPKQVLQGTQELPSPNVRNAKHSEPVPGTSHRPQQMQHSVTLHHQQPPQAPNPAVVSSSSQSSVQNINYHISMDNSQSNMSSQVSQYQAIQRLPSGTLHIVQEELTDQATDAETDLQYDGEPVQHGHEARTVFTPHSPIVTAKIGKESLLLFLYNMLV